MPKLKTHQSVAKRIKVTKRGKVLHRKGGQDHFNSHEPGKTTRTKRRDIQSRSSETRNLKRLMPYT